MDSERATKIIELAGGNTAFARLLGFDIKDGIHQRIHNWKSRGLPSSIYLAHYETIKKLEKQADSA